MRKLEALPERPSGGNRRRLEELWLAQLERDGLSAYLAEPPAAAPPQLYQAIDQFNDGAFWDCHETLEEVWLDTPYPLRFFYHAIIKAAVGLHHMGHHNRHGARVKLSDGVRLLRLFPPEYMGVGTGRLLNDTSWWLARVNVEGNVDWKEADALPKPVIHFADRPPSAGKRMAPAED